MKQFYVFLFYMEKKFSLRNGGDGGGIRMALPLPLSPAVQDLLSVPTLAPPPDPIGPVLFWYFWPYFYPI